MWHWTLVWHSKGESSQGKRWVTVSHRGSVSRAWPYSQGSSHCPHGGSRAGWKGAARHSKSMDDQVGLGSGCKANSWIRGCPSEGPTGKHGHGFDAAAVQIGWDPRSQSLSLKPDPGWMADKERPHWVLSTFFLRPTAVSQGPSLALSPGSQTPRKGRGCPQRPDTRWETHFYQIEGELLCSCTTSCSFGVLFAGLTICLKWFTRAAVPSQRTCPLRAASCKGF